MALNLETDQVLGRNSAGYYHWPHNQWTYRVVGACMAS